MSSLKSQSRLHLLVLPIVCAPLLLLFFYPSVGEWTVFLGRFHPVILHLPIGILLLIALLEFLQLVSFGRLKFSTGVPLFLGALSAVLAMTLGVLLMSGESMEGALVKSHLQWGIATAVAAVLALAIRSWPSYPRRKSLSFLYRAVLAAACGIMGWASHQGASITHGEEYLTAHIPWLSGQGPTEEESELARGIGLPFEERLVYEHLIVPIFEGKCYECHQTTTARGRLIMDTQEGLLAGGEIGPAIVPGNVAQSLAISRVHLPLESEEHMPPKNEPQLTEEEIRVIEWWVEQGAPFDQTIASLEVGTEIEESIGLVSADLLVQLKTPKEPEEVELTTDEVEALRGESFAEETKQLMEQYPGVIRYLSGQSAAIAISCFHETWTDTEVSTLEPIATTIKKLTLPEAEITPASAKVINKMTGLEVLDLRNSPVDDAFIKALKLPNLTRLNLFQTKITDDSVSELKKFEGLKKLYLVFTETSLEAVLDLESQLPDCEIFHHLKVPVEPEIIIEEEDPIEEDTDSDTAEPDDADAESPDTEDEIFNIEEIPDEENPEDAL